MISEAAAKPVGSSPGHAGAMLPSLEWPEIVSFGAGVQTTALVILNLTGKLPRSTSRVVFADTGAEHPDTYAFIQSFRQWISDHGGEFVSVRYGDLYDDYYAKQVIPYRTLRRCTDKYKIRPVRRYLRTLVGTSRTAKATVQLGISTDEQRRAVPSDVQWASNRYPLIELGMSRRDCIETIIQAGVPVPPKSGCFFCPFQGKRAWARLRARNPELFTRAVDLENRASSAKPGVYLHGRYPLAEFDSIADREFDWNELEGECSTGYCFT